jgi:hypothetical protein
VTLSLHTLDQYTLIGLFSLVVSSDSKNLTIALYKSVNIFNLKWIPVSWFFGPLRLNALIKSKFVWYPSMVPYAFTCLEYVKISYVPYCMCKLIHLEGEQCIQVFPSLVNYFVSVALTQEVTQKTMNDLHLNM